MLMRRFGFFVIAAAYLVSEANGDERLSTAQRDQFYKACEPSCYESQAPSQGSSKFTIDASAWHGLCSCVCTGATTQLDNTHYKSFSESANKTELIDGLLKNEPMFRDVFQNCIDSVVNY